MLLVRMLLICEKNMSYTEISLLTEVLNFVTTCNSAGNATLKLELEVFGRMLHLHSRFRNENKDLHPEIFKPKSTFGLT